MRKLLEADLTRIAAKILPWILLLASYIFMAVMLIRGIDGSIDRNFFFLKTVHSGYNVTSLVIGFTALLGVYADEFKSMVMIGVIGRGLSRKKFVIGKLLDLVIYTFVLQVLTVIYVMTLKGLFGIYLNGAETRFLVCLVAFDFIGNIAQVALAALFYFMSENAAVGMFAFLAAGLIIPTTLVFINMQPKLARYHIDSYYILGMLSSISSDFIMGDIVGGITSLLILVAVYVVAVTALTIVIFRKKELEF